MNLLGLLCSPRLGDAQPGTVALEEGQISLSGLRISEPDGISEEQAGLSTAEAPVLFPGLRIADAEVISVYVSKTNLRSVPRAEGRRRAARRPQVVAITDRYRTSRVAAGRIPFMIAPGNIFTVQDAARPESLQNVSALNLSGWVRVRQDLTSQALELELAREGWTFFYIAGGIKRTVFGFNQQRMVASALWRIFRAAHVAGCNSIQIDQVTSGSFLWIPCVTVSAHARHIQKAMIFRRRRQ